MGHWTRNFVSFAGISTPRIILKIPDDLSLISEGSQVRMTCKADGSSDPVFTFYRDSTPLTNNENTEINGKTLKLLSVSTNDNGVYSCKAENRAGEAASRNNLTISILGEFLFFMWITIWTPWGDSCEAFGGTSHPVILLSSSFLVILLSKSEFLRWYAMKVGMQN